MGRWSASAYGRKLAAILGPTCAVSATANVKVALLAMLNKWADQSFKYTITQSYALPTIMTTN